MGWGWGWGGFQHRCLLLCSGPLRRARPLGVARPKTPQKKSMLSAPAAFSLSLSLSLLPFFLLEALFWHYRHGTIVLEHEGHRPLVVAMGRGGPWAGPLPPPPPPGLCLRTQSGVRGGGTTWPSRSQCQHWTLDIDLERGEPGPVREEETLSRHKGQAKYIYEIKERPNWLVSPPSSPHPPPSVHEKK